MLGDGCDTHTMDEMVGFISSERLDLISVQFYDCKFSNS